jgi:hypothetical protein
LLLAASPALADALSATSCARTLSPEALEIYRAAAPDIRQDTDMVSVIRAKVIPMVMSGDMTRSTARIAATAASTCLRSLQERPDEVAERTSLTIETGDSEGGSR